MASQGQRAPEDLKRDLKKDPRRYPKGYLEKDLKRDLEKDPERDSKGDLKKGPEGSLKAGQKLGLRRERSGPSPLQLAPHLLLQAISGLVGPARIWRSLVRIGAIL